MATTWKRTFLSATIGPRNDGREGEPLDESTWRSASLETLKKIIFLQLLNQQRRNCSTTNRNAAFDLPQALVLGNRRTLD